MASFLDYFTGNAGFPQPQLGNDALAQMGQPDSTQPLGFTGGIAANRNAITGLGLGLLSRPGWGAGMEGYQTGAKTDLAGNTTTAKLMEARRQAAVANAFRAQQAALAERAMKLQEAPQFHTLKGPMGETPGTVDRTTGVFTPQAGAGGGAGLSGAVPENYNEQGVDENYLNAVRQQYGNEAASEVKAMAEGRMPTGGFGALKQYGPLVNRYKQGFDATKFATHLQTEKNFQPGGKDSDKLRAVDQGVTHVTQAWDLSERIGGINAVGGGTPGAMANKLYQGWKTLGPGTEQMQSDLKEYSQLVDKIGNELVAASKGASQSDVAQARRILEDLKAAQTPAERRGAFKGAIDFLHGSHEALERKRETGYDQGYQMRPLLQPKITEAMEKIRAHRESDKQPLNFGTVAGAASAPATPATTAAPAVPEAPATGPGSRDNPIHVTSPAQVKQLRLKSGTYIQTPAGLRQVP